jgi:hypothetical protein
VKNCAINYCSEKNNLLEKILVLISILKIFSNSGLDLDSNLKKSFLHMSNKEPVPFKPGEETKPAIARIWEKGGMMIKGERSEEQEW